MVFTHHHIKITENLLPNQLKTCEKVLGICDCQSLIEVRRSHVVLILSTEDFSIQYLQLQLSQTVTEIASLNT